MPPLEGCHGLIHVHSGHSFDGRCTHAQLRELFLDQGLRFACITEHIEGLDQPAIDRIIEQCRTASDASFLFIPGLEMDCFRVIFLGLDPVRVDFSSDRTIFHSLRSHARLCILAHPVKARFAYPDWIIDACDGIEVWNARHDGFHGIRPQNARLFRALCQRKPNPIKLAGLDLHAPADFRPLTVRLQNAGPLTASCVLDQLQHGLTDICKSGQPIDTLGTLARLRHRNRIRMMDLLHAAHKTVANWGLPLPAPLKRVARRIVEG